MVLIPSDVGIRMRMQTEPDLVRQITPIHEIGSDLPEIQPGDRFTARIQETLPDNTYKALVAGKQLTLQLESGAKAGDFLELVLIDRSNKVLVAKQVEGNTASAEDANAYPFAKFSPVARMISQLLPAEGEPPEPAPLNRGQPLLAQAPQSQSAAPQLASSLSRAVAQSGLFYEAHQAQWISGKLPLVELLQEPQGQHSTPGAFQQAVLELVEKHASNNIASSAPNNVAPSANTVASHASNAKVIEEPKVALTLQPALEKVDAGKTALAASAPQVSAAAQQLPDDVRPLVQQQLDAAGTQRLVWHGEVWPRQAMDWEIEWDGDREANGSESEDLRWSTALSLTTPRLGRVDANLRLTTQGVQITLATPYGASAADLRDESHKLSAALEAAGVPLLALHIRHEDEPPIEANT